MILLNTTLLQWQKWSTCWFFNLPPDADQVLYWVVAPVVAHMQGILAMDVGLQ